MVFLKLAFLSPISFCKKRGEVLNSAAIIGEASLFPGMSGVGDLSGASSGAWGKAQAHSR